MIEDEETFDQTIPSELAELLEASLNDEIDEAGLARLEEIVVSNRSARKQAAEYLCLSYDLRVWAADDGLPVNLDASRLNSHLSNEPPKSLVEEVLEEEERQRRLEQQQAIVEALIEQEKQRDALRARRLEEADGQQTIFNMPVFYFGMAVALLVAALTFWPKSDELPTVAAAATLTAQKDASWSTGNFSAGDQLQSGQTVTLSAGFAEITMTSGAIAVIEAPATVSILNSPNAIRLRSGKLVGRCHSDASKGFLVKTDHADITDLGTEFGVEVTHNRVSATVFVGQIKLTPSGGHAQNVGDQQTALLEVNGNDRSLVVENRVTEGFTRWLPREAVIKDAKINFNDFAIEVVPQGAFEGAQLFTDRDYKLKGVDRNGLPDFLRGGDLVRMPVDARSGITAEVGDKLQLELELALTSDVYVLKSSIIEAQDWLKRDYEDTGLLVGVDFSGTEATDRREFQTGVGPGESIDRTFEIWKRKEPALGRTNVAGSTDGAMYAVVVVARDATP
jgi:hypothetical protein